jgi:predicted dehydrogenase
MADIGSHWCDTVQFMTGRRIVEVMADLSIVWPTRQRPWPATRRSASIAMISRMKRGPSIPKIWGRSCFALTMAARGFIVSQVSAGRKNGLTVEINGSRCSLAWDQEVPQRLWIGHRQQPNQLLSDDPSLMLGEAAASAHFPGGHNEGWPDAFKNMMLSFYQAVRAGECRRHRHGVSPRSTRGGCDVHH